ncbi:MAG: peptidylprolyl isomerase [Chloroflexi bacterium]|nr:peptidylprolyl isomerase [Chloroflexota bacterium]
MTLGSRPTPRRSARTPIDADARRTLLINAGFSLVIVAAVLVLAGAAFASWYDEHMASVATVNGEGISKDQLATRTDIELFRLQELYSEVSNAMSLGRISQAEGQQQLSLINQQAQYISSIALENEIDTVLVRQLGRERGVAVDPAAVDAKLTEEATADAQRHAWVITIRPEVSTGATEPTAAQVEAARTEASELQAKLAAGTITWEEAVTSSDDDYASANGDLLYLTADVPSPDEAFIEAIFALPANGVTGVVEGEDGDFRIGRVTDIVAAKTDPAYQDRIADAGIDLADYRRVLEGEVVRDGIEGQLLAEVVDAPSIQRRVSEIYIAGTADGATANEVKSRHILYSPNDDPDAAADLAADDPAWAKAEEEARAAHAKLKAGTADFATLAKAESDDKGSGAEGGDLGYYAPDSGLDQAYADAIFADGLAEGQLLEPVRSSFGWHVIQIVDIRAPASVRIAEAAEKAKAPGADFAALAREHSEGDEAADGGDLGWIARYQLARETEDVLFALQAGQVSEVVEASDGSHIYKVVDVETRKPDEEQADVLRGGAFDNWYQGVKYDETKTKINRPGAGVEAG